MYFIIIAFSLSKITLFMFFSISIWYWYLRHHRNILWHLICISTRLIQSLYVLLPHLPIHYLRQRTHNRIKPYPQTNSDMIPAPPYIRPALPYQMLLEKCFQQISADQRTVPSFSVSYQKAISPLMMTE